MSGKPAAPGAAGAPRLLLYVPDHRPPPLYLPEQFPATRNHTLIYKSDNQTEPEVSFVKDNRFISRNDHMVAKDQSIVEFSNAEGSIRGNVDVDIYQRSPGDTVSSVQPVFVQQNHFVESVRQEGTNCDSLELPSEKNYLNYQLLEQSVTHQSIVNQSISILNQQVGVNKVSEDTATPQLVRTVDGMVLAVLPQSATVLPNRETQELSSRNNSDNILTVTVPLGWRRIISGSSVIYLSPSGSALSTLLQLREYLQTTGTCKCGLPCPLRPEAIFNFDPKVVSKPYQVPTGAEQTKLCNHKRKLLATLSARGQSPATTPPPPSHQQNVEKKVIAKKMKKRASYPANMNVSQLMVQRERPFSEFKTQDVDQRQTTSPGFNRVNQNQPCPPYIQNTVSHQEENKSDNNPHRSSHYLTVNSGWIMHKDGKNCPASNTEVGSSSMGIPVLGTNGQVIGMQTTVKKNINIVSNQLLTEDKKDVRKTKEENQVFCGLNQALTPEVMQKINEQQQLFIQQNQKQIELAMKGYRTQIENDGQKQGQFVPQGQLVIQNGAVVKTNPAKTPPWQVKRNDSMTSPSPKSQKSDSMDFDDSNANLSEDSTNSSCSFQSENMNQMCPRVPPLPQHYNMINQQWPNIETNKKKLKNTKSKKKNSPTENKCMTFDSNGMRTMQDIKNKCDEVASNNGPSFMEDPNGYLAQQTVLLNNTISRQVGISSYDNKYENYPQNHNNKKISKSSDLSNVYRNNCVIPNPTASPSNTPDSSDKTLDVAQCCKGCNVNKINMDSYPDTQMRRNYIKQNMYSGASPKHGFEENPVTSSTYVDRNQMMHDSCGPIQAGTVSTSNFSPIESLPLPEPSPTPSNSSRNTDTPLSNGSHSSQQQGSFPIHSPYSIPGSNRDFSNPSTPGSGQFPYNSPGPPNTQMMHFISNHNVNKNLMEVDNISMVGVKPGLKQDFRDIKLNSMPGYCPPPHLGGGPPQSLVQACYIQTYITTMASGFSVTRDTVTSVQAGKAITATTSINASQANFIRHPPPPSVNLATTYAIPNNHPDPFLHSVNLPTSYPLHIAGTTAQNMISKSPLEMVQNVIGSPSKSEVMQVSLNQMTRKTRPMTPGKIIISSTGQVITNNGPMPPPPPKTSTPLQLNVSNVSTSMTQVVPSIHSVVNPPTVVVNTMQAPFVIQPPMMTVDGQVVQQNNVISQIVAGGQINDGQRQIDIKSGQSFVQGVAMLSPESLKKKKKRKSNAAVTNVIQITAPQTNSGNIMVHHTSPQHNTSPQFSPRGFQLSPNNNISPPILQALTIVPGKSGTPAHIVMNGQGNTSNFGSQQIITNTSPSQQINLLQPVNLINNTNNVVSNFPAFQQFIVPNIGSVVMTADGTIIQDNATAMQLQLQTVNGQNVLTPVQNPGVFTGSNTGVVLRTQNQQGKIIQSQHSPGAQFLSPNSQVMISSPNFNGQLSPLLANVSPTNVTFNTSPQIRSSNVQTQEFIHTNQMGQTLMVPLSPKQVSIATTRSNSTFVQQNTTIVQQQTTLVSNSHNSHATSLANNLQNGNSARLSIDPNILLNTSHRQLNKVQQRNYIEMQPAKPNEEKLDDGYVKFMNEFDMLGEGSADFNHIRHSVSTQTLVNRAASVVDNKSPGHHLAGGSSPPDTTTHSPLGPEASISPTLQSRPRQLTHTNMADTTTSSPEPADANSSAMVQCVSSSEQDMADSGEHAAWANANNEFGTESDTQCLMSNIQLMRQHRQPHNPVESTVMHYPNMNSGMNPQLPSYYEMQSYQHKRKNEFGDAPYRSDKIMRTNYNMLHGAPKENEYNLGVDKTKRHYSTTSGSEVHKVFDRLGNDTADRKSPEEAANKSKFSCGDLIWGPVKGYASWPGKLVGTTDGGKWNVRWFGGDKALGVVEDGRLLTLSEGLEAHHAARIKHRKSRKLNTHLENAIQEAMNELDKKSDVKQQSDLEPTTSVDGNTEITETPKRSKKIKTKKQGGISKTTCNKEGVKLRSYR